jgi:hypothetical protein
MVFASLRCIYYGLCVISGDDGEGKGGGSDNEQPSGNNI